jgi:UDP-N-acetylglucosamine diphosphorylase/glucosamine-1-phosphate N-acetyltransferase
MLDLVFFDTSSRNSLLPFTYTRPMSDVKVGYLNISEKWEFYLGSLKKGYITSSYLSALYPNSENSGEFLFIAGNLLPSEELVKSLQSLAYGQGIQYRDKILAFRFGYLQDVPQYAQLFEQIEWESPNCEIQTLEQLADFQKLLPQEIIKDIDKLQKSIPHTIDHPNIKKTGDSPIYISKNSTIGHCFINTANGPVFISENAEIMDGAMIKGPVIIGKKSLVKMGAKIYENTAIGDNCKVAGEIQSSIIFSNSNKGHEGYLGNSVLGEWCNIGADSNNSNLKNNYEEVKLWSYDKNSFVKTGLQFCGLFMGDHSKCAINTMFNTGTVVGVSANIFGAGFPRNFIPSFSWGGSQGMSTYQLGKALETAKRVYARRGKEFKESDFHVMEHVFNESKKHRNWEK